MFILVLVIIYTTKIQHIKGYYQTFLQLFSNYFNKKP